MSLSRACEWDLFSPFPSSVPDPTGSPVEVDFARSCCTEGWGPARAPKGRWRFRLPQPALLVRCLLELPCRVDFPKHFVETVFFTAAPLKALGTHWRQTWVQGSQEVLHVKPPLRSQGTH